MDLGVLRHFRRTIVRMQVFIPDSHNRKCFHRAPSCRALKLANDVLEVDLVEAKANPCKWCFPEAPRKPRLLRQYCARCDSRRACRHNGGILVDEVHTVHTRTRDLKVGAKKYTRRWVWPDSKMALAQLIKPVVE